MNGTDNVRRIAGWVRRRASCAEPADQEAVEEMSTPDMLRDRLWLVREDALYEMARDGIEPGRLTLAAGAHAALEALGEAPIWWEPPWFTAQDYSKVEVAPACRAVVAGAAGEPIRLTLQSEKDTIAAVELDPAGAVALAGRLIEAALPRLNRA